MNWKRITFCVLLLIMGKAYGNSAVLDLHENLDNRGTIIFHSGYAMKIEKGKWIHNRGRIEFVRDSQGGLNVQIMGTEPRDQEDTTSGIIDYSGTFQEVTGEPNNEDAPRYLEYYIPAITSHGIVVTDTDGKQIEVFDEEKHKHKDEGSDKNIQYCNGGGIIYVTGLYGHLTDNNEANNNANKLVIFRNTRDESKLQEEIVLYDNKETSQDSPLVIEAPFANSDKYQSFTGQENEFVQTHILQVSNGYYKFNSDNREFTEPGIASGYGVEFLGGTSTICKPESVFPVNILVNGGTVEIDFTDSDTKSVTLNKEITVRDGDFNLAEGTEFIIGENGSMVFSDD